MQSGKWPRVHAGLIGNLPLLFSLAAFLMPPSLLDHALVDAF